MATEPVVEPSPSANFGALSRLDGQAAADLHLALVEDGVHAGTTRAGPVAHGVGAVALEQGGRRVGHVARRLGELLAVGVDDEAGDGGGGPRQDVVLVLAADHGGEQPGADDLVGLRAHVHGERALEQVVVVDPPAAICGVSEEVAQVSITSGSAAKPPGWLRWASSKPGAAVVVGSIGSEASSARIGDRKSVTPSASMGYQTGNATPKKRWRVMFQSPISPLTQFS